MVSTPTFPSTGQLARQAQMSGMGALRRAMKSSRASSSESSSGGGSAYPLGLSAGGCYQPSKAGSRFSMKALMASLVSRVAKLTPWPSASASSAWNSEMLEALLR